MEGGFCMLVQKLEERETALEGNAQDKPLSWEEELKNRDALIEKYFGLVRRIASRLMKNLKQVDFDDLVGDGVFGLMKAIEQFDPSRGVKFETYATPVIRGAILNGLRAMDWVPERKRTKTRELQKVMEQFQVVHGREGTEEELAQELQVTAKEVYELIADLGTQYLLSLDQPATAGVDEERSMVETLEDKSTLEPSQEVAFKEERALLKKAIEDLPERENLLIKLYYFEGKSFEEIASEMNVSKQRISQLHAKAVKKLREVLHAGSEDAIGAMLEGAFFLEE
jgi:RNA polymerase sigma factor for flagellar operon FliA